MRSWVLPLPPVPDQERESANNVAPNISTSVAYRWMTRLVALDKAEAEKEREPDPVLTLEPFERFAESNAIIDEHTAIVAEADEYGFLQARVLLPNNEEITLTVEPSRLLFGVDREAYKLAWNACRDAATSRPPVDEEVA